MPIILAERFGGGPFLYEDVPIDRRERLLQLLAVEGQVAELHAGLGPGDSMVLPEGWEHDED